MDPNNYIAEEWARHFARQFAERSIFDSMIWYRRRTWRERWFTLPWRPWRRFELDIPKTAYMGGDKVKINLVPDTMHIMQQQTTGFERKLLNPRVQSLGYFKVPGWKPPGPAPCTDMMLEGGEDWLPED